MVSPPILVSAQFLLSCSAVQHAPDYINSRETDTPTLIFVSKMSTGHGKCTQESVYQVGYSSLPRFFFGRTELLGVAERNDKNG